MVPFLNLFWSIVIHVHQFYHNWHEFVLGDSQIEVFCIEDLEVFFDIRFNCVLKHYFDEYRCGRQKPEDKKILYWFWYSSPVRTISECRGVPLSLTGEEEEQQENKKKKLCLILDKFTQWSTSFPVVWTNLGRPSLSQIRKEGRNFSTVLHQTM